MKVICIGDIHGRDSWMSVNIDEYDLVVFLGDYTDSYDESNVQILYNLKAIIQTKKTYPDKIVLLLGNHDVQYMNNQGDSRVRCSGYRPEAYYDLHRLFNDNKDLFSISFQVDNYLWSHAGVHRGWYDYSLTPALKVFELDASKLIVSEQINSLHAFNANEIYQIGHLRGGFNPVGGPLWCDKQLSSKKPLEGFNQIVGHTPVKDIITININDDTSITYCDVLEAKEKFYELEI